MPPQQRMSHLDDSTHITNPSRKRTRQYPRQEFIPSRPTSIIDFDVAAAAWHSNKIRRGAMYYYRCTATLKDGRQCSRCATHAEKITCKAHAKLLH